MKLLPNTRKMIAVRCKFTQVFYKVGPWEGTKFVTMDISNATPYEDTEETRAWFMRNFPFELEFVEL